MEPAAAWTEAFVAAQAELPVVPKNKTANAGQYAYAYADLPSIIEAVRPVLAKHGLAFAQSIVEGPGVETRIIHRAGHVEKFGPVLMPPGGNAQAMGSAISYARRYSLCAALGIAPDEDDDAEAPSSKQRQRSVGVAGRSPAGKQGDADAGAGPSAAPRPTTPAPSLSESGGTEYEGDLAEAATSTTTRLAEDIRPCADCGWTEFLPRGEKFESCSNCRKARKR